MSRQRIAMCFALALVAAAGASRAQSTNRTAINFMPWASEFSADVEEYRTIWAEDGHRIVASVRKATGLSLELGPIQAVVYEGASFSGHHEIPMRLRASYTSDTKRATLVHELSHRLISDLVPSDFEDHPIIFLFLYDVWVDLWGMEFADEQVGIESQRRGLYDYEGAWNEVLALGREVRSQQWSTFLAERQGR